MVILQVCAYGAEYPGNFIASLEYLEKQMFGYGFKTIYAFVERAKETIWCREIQKRTKVYFLPEAKARIKPETYRIFKKIYQENNVIITHSHFELYDIPATVMASQKTRVFWHLHDPINGGKGIRKLLWRIQYGIVGKKARLLSVSDFYRNKAVSMGFPRERTTVILNSIDLNRVCSIDANRKIECDFLTFGWDFYRKGDDIILDACFRLEKEGYKFTFLLNGNENTWRELENYLGGKRPDFLICGKPVDDVNTLFAKTGVFIQASRQETFSYAVCEAAYAGLPVLCSDIAGLEWAKQMPTISFFEPNNANALYEVMKSYLEHQYVINKNQTMKTHNLIRNNFSLDSWARQVMHQYGIGE